MEKNKNSAWAKEFQQFLNSEGQAPKNVKEKMMEQVKRDLHPSIARVFAKNFVVHLLAGVVGLLFCPQFGFSFTKSMGLMEIYHHFGEVGCTLLCGMTFMSFGLFLSAMILNPDELRQLRQNRVLQTTLLVTSSLGIFLCMGAQVLEYLTLVWALGGMIAGVGALELGALVRLKVVKKSS